MLASLFSGPDTVHKLMWQEDHVSVADLIHECLQEAYDLAAGPSLDGKLEAPDQLDVVGSDDCDNDDGW